MKVSKQMIIDEISKTAFTDDTSVKISDKLRALHLLNQIIKEENKNIIESEECYEFLDDL